MTRANREPTTGAITPAVRLVDKRKAQAAWQKFLSDNSLDPDVRAAVAGDAEALARVKEHARSFGVEAPEDGTPPSALEAPAPVTPAPGGGPEIPMAGSDRSGPRMSMMALPGTSPPAQAGAGGSPFPAYPNAQKGPDGQYYVQQNGQWYKVNP